MSSRKRIARPGGGKSGGFRTIIAARLGRRAFFVEGFAKNERANIEEDDLAALRKLARDLLGMDETTLRLALARKKVTEILNMAKKVLRTVHETAKDLFEIGAIDKVTMREYDLLCLPPVHQFGADEIRQVRKSNQVSQAVFARFLGVGQSTVQQWEQGAKRPSSPALRLLELVQRKGLPALVENLRERSDVAPAS